MRQQQTLQPLSVQCTESEAEPYFRPIVERLLPRLFDSEQITEELLTDEIPLVRSSDWASPPFLLSIFLVCQDRSDISKFFQEMVVKWLVPGRRVRIDSYLATRFSIPEVNQNQYFIAQAVIPVESRGISETIYRNFPTVAREIKLGLASRYHARRILEIKGISTGEKTVLIQERIAYLVARFPTTFDYDIFSLMQRYLITVSEKYMQERSHQLMVRIICLVYAFLYTIELAQERHPNKRHVKLRIIPSTLQTPFGTKRVLGFLVGLNFIKDSELFDQRHVKRAVQKIFPKVQIVENSSFTETKGSGRILALYVEMEKEGGVPFSDSEIERLRRELGDHLKSCIESLVRPVFMPRDEEEIMKYVVTLSSEVREIEDLPQVVVKFDEQTDRELNFSVVIARVIRDHSPSIIEFVQEVGSKAEIVIEKVRRIGTVQSYPKEVAVLRMRLAISPFLRDDFAVDLYRARKRVVSLLKDYLGDLRDYNGGMLEKQMEAFQSFKISLGQQKANHYLMENFFYSLYPSEQRAVIPADRIKTLYGLFEEVRVGGDEGDVTSRKKVDGMEVFWCGKFDDPRKGKTLIDAVRGLKIPGPQLVQLYLTLQDVTYVGFFFFGDSRRQQEIFLEEVEDHL